MNLLETIGRMKQEIKADILAGKVPRTVASFSELHDYVDANCYGGFCDENYLTMVWAFYDAHSDDGCPAEVYEFINVAQLAIDAWICAGGLAIKAGDTVQIRPEWQDVGDSGLTWVAIEDEDGGRVRIAPADSGLTFPPNYVVNVTMLF